MAQMSVPAKDVSVSAKEGSSRNPRAPSMAEPAAAGERTAGHEDGKDYSPDRPTSPVERRRVHRSGAARRALGEMRRAASSGERGAVCVARATERVRPSRRERVARDERDHPSG